LAALGLEHLAAVALAGDEKPIGCLIVANKRNAEFDSVDGKLIRAVASEAGVFLTNHRLFADVQELLIGVLDALTASIDAKDPYTCGHSRRVAVLSKRLAEAVGLPPKRAERVYLAGLLHDIGKIGVPERILRKPGRLSDAEFGVIQKHPEISAKILSGIRQLEDVVPGIRHHHERIDGGGYPDGLKGEDIPLEGRIIGLADCFDALTSNRVYRKAMPISTVTDVIETNAGTQFDAVLAEKLLSMDLEGFMAEFRESMEATSQLADELEELS
jgi:putative nucleotidyltransferase with HDIG domain